jgi:hypothetical protein
MSLRWEPSFDRTRFATSLDKCLQSLDPTFDAPQISILEVAGTRHLSDGTAAFPCVADVSGRDRGFSVSWASVRLPQCPTVQDSLLLLYRSGASGLGSAQGAKP